MISTMILKTARASRHPEEYRVWPPKKDILELADDDDDDDDDGSVCVSHRTRSQSGPSRRNSC